SDCRALSFHLLITEIWKLKKSVMPVKSSFVVRLRRSFRLSSLGWVQNLRAARLQLLETTVLIMIGFLSWTIAALRIPIRAAQPKPFNATVVMIQALNGK
ncbi:MAG: hypothetical protein V3W19_03785, partial [Desulfatiglandales bacterium]